jgi:hypothetical protein
VPQGRALDDKTRAAILNDIKAGDKSCRGIAADHGVSRTAVSKIAKDAGIADAFGRQKTKKATEAHVADGKAARALEAAESITAAAWLRQQIRTAKNGRDAQGWATAYGIMSDKHMAFEKYDSDNGTGEARSMLSALAEGLRVAYDQLPADE